MEIVKLFSGSYSVFLQILGVVFGLGVLIFVHELGHFVMAKLYRVRVLKFAFGFGPELFGFTKGETRYAVCTFPLGGMVEMAGEYSNEQGKIEPKEGDYLYCKWYKRIMIAVMGPLMNYILAIFLFWTLFTAWGITVISEESFIGKLAPEMAAQKAGMQEGDKIISIDNVEIKSWDDILDNMQDKADKQVNISVLRNNEKIDFTFIADKNPITDVGMLGIQPKVTMEKTSFLRAAYLSAQMVWIQTAVTVLYLWDKLVTWEKPELAGPVGVIQIMAKSADAGLSSYIRLIAIISVALGLFNLFPIPLVDGGMIVLFIVEGIIRKRISMKVIQIYNTIGVGIILLILIFATYSDLIRLGIGKLFH